MATGEGQPAAAKAPDPDVRAERAAGRFASGVKLTGQHLELLRTIGETGAPADRLRRHGREFGELSAAHLIVFWPDRGERPTTIYGGGVVPGRWYLTGAGAEALGIEPPTLRLA